MHILGVVGARPNFMKMDPVLRALEKDPERFSTTLVHTGQHYDDAMSRVFFEQLGLRVPDVDLGVGSGTHAVQTASVMMKIEPVLAEVAPDVVVVVGDVNSTLAAALVAAKLGIPIAHVEAGLRSFDRRMPEEINRIVTDALSSFLLTPSPDGDENLLKEGVAPEKIHRVGNVMIDTLLRCRNLARESEILRTLGLESKSYCLVTIHRPSNVDDPDALVRVIQILLEVADRLPVVFPAHPRSVRRIEEAGLMDCLDGHEGIRRIGPQSYLDFLALQSEAAVVLTDSGGVQEETTVLGVPCLTLRENTERPVTVTQGTNEIVGLDRPRIVESVDRVLRGEGKEGRIPDLWDGHAAERIVDVFRKTSVGSAR